MKNQLIAFFKTKVYRAIALLVLILVIGVAGYVIISDYSIVDALYMTVITITTVGFGEVVPLDHKAKVFTIFLILASIVIVGYALSVITEYILSKNDIDELKQKKMQKKIDALSNHVIICGYGRNGKQAAVKLTAYGKAFVVIEKNTDIKTQLQHDGVLYVMGNANDDKVLLEAGARRASCLSRRCPMMPTTCLLYYQQDRSTNESIS